MTTATAVNSRFCAAMLAALMATAPAAGKSLYAPKCKAPVTGTGTSLHLSDAKTLAKNIWLSKVTSHYGSSYAKLSEAKVLVDHCQPVGKSAGCTFTAHPCKTVNVNLSPSQQPPPFIALPQINEPNRARARRKLRLRLAPLTLR